MPADSQPKLFLLRFDVDTPQCLADGVPALIDLAGRHGVPMTFFVNMGRAVNRLDSLAGLVGGPRRPAAAVAEKLSPRAKLGTHGFLRTALLNPRVGDGQAATLARARDAGHEIGLHGGRNHATWQRHAPGWARERVRSEVDWGLAALEREGVQRPAAFASPGWASPPGLAEVLAEKGFRILADSHDPRRPARLAASGNGPLCELNTNLAGEPGGVGFVEHCDAAGMADGAVADLVDARLASHDSVMVYDHPVYAGGRGAGRLEFVIRHAQAAGCRFVTVSELAGNAA